MWAFSFASLSMFVNIENLDFGQKHIMLVGAFALIASNIQYIIELILLGLIGSNRRYGGATIRWISINQQISLIIKIIADRYGNGSETYIQLKKSLNKAEDAINDRNSYLHRTFLVDEYEGKVTSFAHLFETGPNNPEDPKFVKSFKRGQFDIPLQEIDLSEMNDKLMQAITTMINLKYNAFRYGLPFPAPSLGKLPEQNEGKNHIEDQNQDTQPPPPQSS